MTPIIERILVGANGCLQAGGREMRCAIGRGGVRLDKREGDGATPVGIWPLRRVFYRADRENPPVTGLSVTAIDPRDGWCDAPGDPAYNQPVRLPYPASAEALWRDDASYDLVVVVGYNDDPPQAGLGSAIFIHVARADFSPTEGCVALAAADLRALLALCGPKTALCVTVEEAR